MWLSMFSILIPTAYNKVVTRYCLIVALAGTWLCCYCQHIKWEIICFLSCRLSEVSMHRKWVPSWNSLMYLKTKRELSQTKVLEKNWEFPPITIFKIIIISQPRYIHILFRFSQFHLDACVCARVCVCIFVCVLSTLRFCHLWGFVYAPPQSRYPTIPTPQGSLVLSFCTLTPTPKPSISKVLSLQKCYKMESYSLLLFEIGFFHSA